MPTFSRTKDAIAHAAGSAQTWDRMLLPEFDQSRGRRDWLAAFRRRRNRACAGLPAGSPAFPSLSVTREAAKEDPPASPLPPSAASDRDERPPQRPLHLRAPQRPVKFRLVDPLIVCFPAILAMRSQILPRAYLQSLGRLIQPAADARERVFRRPAMALPAPLARLALPAPDPADPLRRQLPVPVVARPISLVPALATWLPVGWREPVRPPAAARRRPGGRHLLATVAAALALVAGGPLLLSAEDVWARLGPALDLLLGDGPAAGERREIVLVGPESAAAPAPGPEAPGEGMGEGPTGAPGDPPSHATSTTTGPSSAATAAAAPAAADDAPGSWSSLYQLGHTLWSAGKIDDAITAFQGASELNPAHPAIAYDLGWALQRAGRGDEAIPHYRRALELRPDHAFAQYNLGFLLKERGRNDEAAPLLGRAVELLPGNAYAAFDYATLLETRGDLIGAAEMYLRAKQNANGTQLAADANRRLDRIERVIREQNQS